RSAGHRYHHRTYRRLRALHQDGRYLRRRFSPAQPQFPSPAPDGHWHVVAFRRAYPAHHASLDRTTRSTWHLWHWVFPSFGRLLDPVVRPGGRLYLRGGALRCHLCRGAQQADEPAYGLERDAGGGVIAGALRDPLPAL